MLTRFEEVDNFIEDQHNDKCDQSIVPPYYEHDSNTYCSTKQSYPLVVKLKTGPPTYTIQKHISQQSDKFITLCVHQPGDWANDAAKQE